MSDEALSYQAALRQVLVETLLEAASLALENGAHEQHARLTELAGRAANAAPAEFMDLSAEVSRSMAALRQAVRFRREN